jgi:hypothetical protein
VQIRESICSYIRNKRCTRMRELRVMTTPSLASLRFINAAASCTPHLVAFLDNKVKLYLLISLFIAVIAFARAEPKFTRHPPQMWPHYMHYTMPHKV